MCGLAMAKAARLAALGVQTRRREMAEFLIEIECRPDPPGVDTRRGVQEVFESSLGLRPEVTVVPPSTLPRFELKAQRFFVD